MSWKKDTQQKIVLKEPVESVFGSVYMRKHKFCDIGPDGPTVYHRPMRVRVTIEVLEEEEVACE